MDKNLGKLLSIFLLVVLLLPTMTGATARSERASVGAPTVVSYQGLVKVSSSPYTGTGYFKFAVVDAAVSTSFWSNDGTSSAGSEPSASIALSVTDGLFHVLLGDTSLTGMSSPMTDAVFSTSTDTYLRVWFSSNGSTFTRLTPDQKIAAVPYALQAESAKDADTLDSLDSTAFQLQVSGSCSPGATIQSVNTDGSVSCEPHDTLPLYSMIDHGVVGGGHDVAMAPNGLPFILSYMVDQIDAVACHDIQCSQMTLSSSVPVPGASWSLGIAMAFGVDGLPAFTVWDSTSGLPFFGHCDDSLCTAITMLPLVPQAFPAAGQVDMDMTMGVDGLPMIAGVDSSNTLFMAHCLDPFCGAATTAPVAPPVSGRPSITITGDGLPMAAYTDVATGQLGTTVCTDYFCAGAVLSVAHPTAPSAVLPAMTTGADGFGSIAYIDTSIPSIRYAKCNSGSCMSVTTNHIWGVTLPFLLSPPSIVTGSDELPLIGFYDDTSLPGPPPANPGFFTAHCADQLCTNTTTFQQAVGSYDGWRSALTVGTDGMPFVVYEISATTTTMAMHCSNRLCVPFWRGW